MVALGVEGMLPATAAALEALPEGVKGEIIDGVLYTQRRPRSVHQKLILDLGSALAGPFERARGGPGGWWILPEPGITVAGSAEFSPDLAGWRKTRMVQLPADRTIDMAPDWACEVLSPSTRSYDQVVKRAFYARVGVGHLWYVDPEAETVMVSRLEGGRWVEVGVFGRAGKMRAEPFDILEIDLAAWWPAR